MMDAGKRTINEIFNGSRILENCEIISPVEFTDEMNDLYMMIFSFSNDTPISINVFP